MYGCCGHLGHVTSIMPSDFHILIPESFHAKFGSDRHSSLKGFTIYGRWRPSWSCGPDAADKLSFPLPKEAPHKIWL